MIMIESLRQLILLTEISKREKVLRFLRPTSSCVLKCELRLSLY